MVANLTTSERVNRRDALKAGALAVTALLPLSAPHIARAAARRTIAFVPKALSIPVFYYAHYGALQRARELGDVNIEWAGPTIVDPNQQAEIISGLVSRHVDGLAVSAGAPQPLVQLLNRAVEQGTVVTTWDSDVPGSQRKLYYGVDNYKMGLTLGEQTASLIGGSGLVILESGNPGSTDQNMRLKGVASVFKKYPAIRTIGPFFQNDDLIRAQSLTDDLLLAHQGAAALLMVSGAALFGKMDGMPQLRKNQGKIKVLSTDNAPTEMPFVKEGLVQVLVGQDYWGWGYQSTTIIHNLLTQPSCKYPEFVRQAMPIINSQNVDQWIDRWKNATSVEGAAEAFREAPIGCM